ncbi:MAG: polymer-forming cytoskeletal protein [Coriobacteriales bacterium]|nr:polymer-forming cytoskeletal protein [Coriobacteriales bacterium]
MSFTQSLWPNADLVTPAPMSAPPLKADAPAAPAPPAPPSVVPGHIPASSLIDPPPIQTNADDTGAQTPVLKDQPAPDPRTRITDLGDNGTAKPSPNEGRAADETTRTSAPAQRPVFTQIEMLEESAKAKREQKEAAAAAATAAAAAEPAEPLKQAVPLSGIETSFQRADRAFAAPDEPTATTAPTAAAATTPTPTPAAAAAAPEPAEPLIAAAPLTVEPESPVAVAIDEEAAAAVEKARAEQLALASSDRLSAEAAGGREGATFVTGEPIEVEEEPVEKGISVITREATVLGDIITEGHIDIVGRVKGNIDAKGDVAIHGIVRGDIDGSKIGLYSCRVKGNLNAGLGVIVDDTSIIGGDVKTKNIIFDGKVKGNIDADNVVVLRSHSYCLGDVSAASLAVEPGAILNGKVRTLVDGDLEAPFEEVM